jgi:hypothetical protein
MIFFICILDSYIIIHKVFVNITIETIILFEIYGEIGLYLKYYFIYNEFYLKLKKNEEKYKKKPKHLSLGWMLV